MLRNTFQSPTVRMLSNLNTSILQYCYSVYSDLSEYQSIKQAVHGYWRSAGRLAVEGDFSGGISFSWVRQSEGMSQVKCRCFLGMVWIGIFHKGTVRAGMSEAGVHIPMQDYKLDVSVTIWATLYNTSRTQRQLLTGCTISSAKNTKLNAALKIPKAKAAELLINLQKHQQRLNFMAFVTVFCKCRRIYNGSTQYVGLSNHYWLTTCKAVWYIIWTCLSVCMYVSRAITFESIDVGSSYLHMWCISTGRVRIWYGMVWYTSIYIARLSQMSLMR